MDGLLAKRQEGKQENLFRWGARDVYKRQCGREWVFCLGE